MRYTYNLLALLFCSTLLAQQTPAESQGGPITIMNATAHIGNGEVIENSIIILEDGKIEVIGDATVMRIAPRGEVIRGQGLHVYPGIIAANSTLGLVEIDAVKATRDEDEIGAMNPHIRSIIAYNTESKVVESMRPNGVLIAQITPRGGRISGTSSVVQLDAWNWEDAVIRKGDGIHINWPVSFRRTGTWYNPGPIKPNKNYEDDVKELEDFFAFAKAYHQKSKHKEKDIKFEAMAPVLEGNASLYLHVSGEKSIIDALSFAEENKLDNVILVGAREAYKVVDRLKEADVPVLVQRVHKLPAREDTDYDLPYRLPKILMDAGILVGLENAGSMERHQGRNFPFYAGTVAGYGLDMEKALQLITLNPARILGIDDEYGSLETGKSATLFISKGNALDVRGNVITRAFIDGRDISLESHQTELYKRYMEKYGLEDEIQGTK